jgi:hypothetical protein
MAFITSDPRSIGRTIAMWLARRTGMNIDLQFQSQPDVETYEGRRNSMGRTLRDDDGEFWRATPRPNSRRSSTKRPKLRGRDGLDRGVINRAAAEELECDFDGKT